MNKENNILDSIKSNVQYVKMLSAKLNIEEKLKRQLLSDLEHSFVNLEKMRRLVK